MLYRKNFFKNFSLENKKFYQNLKETKKKFHILRTEIKNKKIPFLNSFEKNYKFDFSQQTINKFNKFKNIIVIGSIPTL